MHAWFDLYSRKQTQILTPPIQTHVETTAVHKCPFDYMIQRRLVRVKQVLHFFDSICKENDPK
jgi:hypothetical protein